MTTILAQVSEEMTTTVKRMSPSLVRVEARKRLPATGVVWTADGLIVTAHHVVTQQEGIRVGLDDGRTVEARLGWPRPNHGFSVTSGSSITPRCPGLGEHRWDGFRCGATGALPWAAGLNRTGCTWHSQCSGRCLAHTCRWTDRPLCAY